MDTTVLDTRWIAKAVTYGFAAMMLVTAIVSC